MISLTHEPIDYAALSEAVRRPGCGGVVLFLGTVRDLTGAEVTEALEYEAYTDMAERKLAEIEREARERWPVGEMAVVHRLGRLGVGEVSVAVAVSCPHRAEAFEACRYTIDRLKQIVPIWKKDNRPDGSSDWVHPDGAVHERVAPLERRTRSAGRPNEGDPA
jgi:molybdopterin synthase catalytic subunit